MTPAHAFSYRLHIGPVPDGLCIDHLCRTHLCVNPAHLEAVRPRTNTLRGESPSAIRHRASHCMRGHPYTPENTYIYAKTGWRICRICHDAAVRERDRCRPPRKRTTRK
ncbi:MAG: HNH endonuclease [Chloroflexi bacterium]|nr:HNH endonuclease [Chloroflexota bacterium]